MTQSSSDQIKPPSFLTRLKWLGRKGKTNEESIASYPEVNYQPTAMGYEKLTGEPHQRQARQEEGTHTTRHKIQSAFGQVLVNGTNSHEYLAMDSMADELESLEESLTHEQCYLEQKFGETTDQLLGYQPSCFLFPNVLRFPSFWFQILTMLTGMMSFLSYFLFIGGGMLLVFFNSKYTLSLHLNGYFTPGFHFYFFTLQPLYYLFFKALVKTGIANLFDPPFVSGAALRRDLGVLRFVNKKGEVNEIPFEELEARTTTMWDGGNRAMSKLYLAHKYSKEGAIYGAPHKNAWYVGVLWEYLQHFMDVSRPLPDVPQLEPYRHLDPTTREWDKKHNRPPRLWRDMTQEEYRQLIDASIEAAKIYPFLAPDEVNAQGWKPAGDGKHWYQLG
ncbi:MAG: hypothetical protein P8X74_00790 [Reinekea sp.]